MNLLQEGECLNFICSFYSSLLATGTASITLNKCWKVVTKLLPTYKKGLLQFQNIHAVTVTFNSW